MNNRIQVFNFCIFKIRYIGYFGHSILFNLHWFYLYIWYLYLECIKLIFCSFRLFSRCSFFFRGKFSNQVVIPLFHLHFPLNKYNLSNKNSIDHIYTVCLNDLITCLTMTFVCIFSIAVNFRKSSSISLPCLLIYVYALSSVT